MLFTLAQRPPHSSPGLILAVTDLCIRLTSAENKQECCHPFLFQIDKDSSSRNGKLQSAVLWEKSWRSLFLQQQLGWDFEVGTAPHPMHSSMSVYFGHARVNPPGDMHCSCFMVEHTQLPFVWGYFSLLLTLGFALPLGKKKCGGRGALWGDLFLFSSVWTLGVVLNKLEPGQWSVKL